MNSLTETPAECRAAIDKMTREVPLVHRVLTDCRMRGLNGEDQYSVLAFYAITEMLRAFEMHVEHIRRCTYQAPMC